MDRARKGPSGTAAIKDERMAMPTCWRCGNTFPRSDKRGWVNPKDRNDGTCPLCNAMFMHGCEAWAIKNDCNGVFSSEVYCCRADAEAECAKPEWQSAGCRVVPVRVVDEPEEEHWSRERTEAERGWKDVDRRWPI